MTAVTKTTTDLIDAVRLRGLFTTRSPLSHIGETVSTTAYLVQDPVVQPDGSVVEVFSYSGNAWRGQLRDIMARRVAEAVGARLPADSFHLLFSGGRIEQDKGLDLESARAVRATLPMLGLLGGGIGSQILSGKLRVCNSYPLCQEAIPVLPTTLHEEAAKLHFGTLTFEKEFSRRDDGRFDDGEKHMAQEAVAAKASKVAAGNGEMAPANDKARPKPSRKAQADQMRMGVELLAPGAKLFTEIHGWTLTRPELGCLVRALADFASSPFIGGQGNKGHGLVELEYALSGSLTDAEFVRVDRDGVRLSPLAAELMAEYEEHLVTSVAAMKELLKCA